MKKRSSIDDHPDLDAVASPERRPVVVMIDRRILRDGAPYVVDHLATLRAGRLTRWSLTRLGAILALTLAGVTITVAYDRTRDDSATSRRRARPHRRRCPRPRRPSADPSSTVDITGPQPDHRPGHDDDHGDVDTRLDAHDADDRGVRAISAQRLVRPRCSASAPAAHARCHARRSHVDRQRQCRSRSCSRVTRSSKARRPAKLAANPSTVLAADGAGDVAGRRHDGEPRDIDHDARLARAEGRSRSARRPRRSRHSPPRESTS